MKVTYFDHYVVDSRNPEKRIKFDWDTILKGFTSKASLKLRESFKSATGESLFLFWVADRTYLFVVTRDNDIIKAVNSRREKCEDILHRLEQNEKLGFASYLVVEPWYLGVASTLYGPKSTSVIGFLDDLLRKGPNAGNLKVYGEAFGVSMTAAEATNLAYVGNVRITVDPTSNLFQMLSAQLGMTHPDQVKSLQIIAKPSPRKNMVDDFKKMAEKLGSEPLVSYVVKAKADLDESAMDFFLVGNGALGDIVPTKDEAKLRKAIKERAHQNERLTAEVEKLKADERYEEQALTPLVYLSEPSNWVRVLPDGPASSGSK